MLGWWKRWKKLRELGILGINQRNTECILDENPRHAFPLVDNKAMMHDLCIRIGVPTPKIYGIIWRHSSLNKVEKLLLPHEDFVIKPNRGSGGRGIMVVTGKENGTFKKHNGQPLEMLQIRQHVSDVISGLFSLGERPDQALIQQRVLLHPAFGEICYQGIGDVRVIVYRRKPLMAMLRLPTKVSGGRANLHQGGIGAGVELETGRTTMAVIRDRVAEIHPDTGVRLIGFQVPCWDQVIEMACKVAGAVGLGYIGVDIVLDRDQGPLLLEANARPGLAIQIANGRGLIPCLRKIRDN
jgi:alpha-L-glutamate ligase-like protein